MLLFRREYADVSVILLEKDTYSDDWMTYCRCPFICFGLYCDTNQTINENGDCVFYNFTNQILMTNNIMAYVYFKESYENSTPSTNLQAYYNKLMSKKVPLKSSQPFSMYYLQTYLTFTIKNYQLMSRRADSAPFVVRKTDEQIYLVDFECSLQDAVNKLIKVLYNSLQECPILNRTLDILSIICLLLIIFSYLMSKDLRKKVAGKSILIYSSLAMYTNAQEMVPIASYINPIFMTTTRYLYYMLKMWINVICFETFFVMRYIDDNFKKCFYF
jgi:hypothetical protein